MRSTSSGRSTAGGGRSARPSPGRRRSAGSARARSPAARSSGRGSRTCSPRFGGACPSGRSRSSRERSAADLAEDRDRPSVQEPPRRLAVEEQDRVAVALVGEVQAKSVLLGVARYKGPVGNPAKRSSGSARLHGGTVGDPTTGGVAPGEDAAFLSRCATEADEGAQAPCGNDDRGRRAPAWRSHWASAPPWPAPRSGPEDATSGRPLAARIRTRTRAPFRSVARLARRLAGTAGLPGAGRDVRRAHRARRRGRAPCTAHDLVRAWAARDPRPGHRAGPSARYVRLEKLVLGARRHPERRGDRRPARLCRSPGGQRRQRRWRRRAAHVRLLEHAGAAVIEENMVHHCGTGANYASGIAASISVNARIADNTIYANPGDGITPGPERAAVPRDEEPARRERGGRLLRRSGDVRVARQPCDPQHRLRVAPLRRARVVQAGRTARGATSCSTTASGARHGWAETASWPPATASSIHV